MRYAMGLGCALVAVALAAGNTRRREPSSLLGLGATAAASALVFYTVLGNLEVGSYRPLDALEVALACVPPLAMAVGRGLQKPASRVTMAPAVGLSAVLIVSLADAAGLTHIMTGPLPGAGIVAAPWLISLVHPFLGAATYCRDSSFSGGLLLAAASVGGFFGVATARRDHRLMAATIAAIALFAAALSTRDMITCVQRPWPTPEVGRGSSAGPRG